MNLDETRKFLDALAGRDTIYDFRVIHDSLPGDYGKHIRGRLDDVSATLDAYQAQGYGVFIVINETDGNGVTAANVRTVRAHFADIDGDDAQWSKYRAIGASENPPSFYVFTSPGKFHAYWRVQPYAVDQRFEQLQRKLVARWQSDPRVIDPPRVMRLPGSLHLKNPQQPIVVSFMPGTLATYAVSALEWTYASVATAGSVETFELGDPLLAAPSVEWANYALAKIEPATLDRGEWLKITAAFKAAVWQWGEPAARAEWDKWCARYPDNDPTENDKLWRSIKQTKTGFNYLARVSGVLAEMKFGGTAATVPTPVVPTINPNATIPTATTDIARSILDTGNPFLTPKAQQRYFEGCVYIGRLGEIMTPTLRFMGPGPFNALYGGKVFVLDSAGTKTTDEPWKAATRGQVFTVPKVDDIRFVPTATPGAVLTDELGRKAVNIYRPITIVKREGDATPWLALIRALLRDERDVRIVLSYMAHCVQRPGVKALWCPVIQSIEGAGKGLIGEALKYAVGILYTHEPNARELADSGQKFNAWMRARLLIIANEIRTDDRRDMLEVLKPFITEKRLEVQGKGANQEMEDNVANWIMFTNFQDAVPISRDSRRYAIFYSTIQDVRDLAARGMNGDYFPRMWAWFNGGGREVVADYLHRYVIDPEYDPAGLAHRAPETSSTQDALKQSLTPVEQRIVEAVEAGETGFRNGWLSSYRVTKLLQEAHINIAPQSLKRIYTKLGYYEIGRATHKLPHEEMKQPYLYNVDATANAANYGFEQGYR